MRARANEVSLRVIFPRRRPLGATPADRLAETANGARLTVAGLVLVRQRPGTAKGVIFVTLEDETGPINCIVWPKAFERYRKAVLTAKLLGVTGTLQREGLVVHVVGQTIFDLTGRLRLLDREGKEPMPVPAGGLVCGPPSARDAIPKGRSFK